MARDNISPCSSTRKKNAKTPLRYGPTSSNGGRSLLVVNLQTRFAHPCDIPLSTSRTAMRARAAGADDFATVFSRNRAWRGPKQRVRPQGARRLHSVRPERGAGEGRRPPKNEKVIREMIKRSAIRPRSSAAAASAIWTRSRAHRRGVSSSSSARGGEENRLSERASTVSRHSSSVWTPEDRGARLKGWSKMTGHDVVDPAKKVRGIRPRSAIYTDIGRDGRNRRESRATLKLAQAIKTPIIASGA